MIPSRYLHSLLLALALLAPRLCGQVVLVSNLAAASSGSILFSQTTERFGIAFTTGSTAMTLSSASFILSGNSSPTVVAGLFTDSGGLPTSTGSGGLLATSDSNVVTNGLHTVAFDFSTLPVLAATTTYDLVFWSTTPTDSPIFVFSITDSTIETGTSGWSLSDSTESYSSDSGASWSSDGESRIIQVELTGTAIPEPAATVTATGAIALALAAWRQRRKAVR